MYELLPQVALPLDRRRRGVTLTPTARLRGGASGARIRQSIHTSGRASIKFKGQPPRRHQSLRVMKTKSPTGLPTRPKEEGARMTLRVLKRMNREGRRVPWGEE